MCDLKDGVSYPGLASDGSYIYIFENRNLQVYHIETDTMRIYELAALDVENTGLFYWRNTDVYKRQELVCIKSFKRIVPILELYQTVI